jgi:hypothetical protein
MQLHRDYPEAAGGKHPAGNRSNLIGDLKEKPFWGLMKAMQESGIKRHSYIWGHYVVNNGVIPTIRASRAAASFRNNRSEANISPPSN